MPGEQDSAAGLGGQDLPGEQDSAAGLGGQDMLGGQDSAADCFDERVTSVLEGQGSVASGSGSASSTHTSGGVAGNSYIHLALEDVRGGLKTSMGNYMKRILGCDQDLVTFDQLRFSLKEDKKKTHNKAMVSRYNQLCCSLRARVLSQKSELDKEVATIEGGMV